MRPERGKRKQQQQKISAKLVVQRCQEWRQRSEQGWNRTEQREKGMRNEEDSLREREKEQKGIGEHRDGRRKPGLQIPPGHCVKAKCVPRKWRCETALSLSFPLSPRSFAHTKHRFPLSLPALCLFARFSCLLLGKRMSCREDAIVAALHVPW